jgi:hypothetical protein
MMPVLLTALLCSFFNVFYNYLGCAHPPYDLNTMATAVDRALLCILSKDALEVMYNIEVIFVHVFRIRIAQ